MAGFESHERLQLWMKYKLQKISLLQKALTAPGAEGDKGGSSEEREKYEGNRLLALIGTPFCQLAVHKGVLVEKGALQKATSNCIQSADKQLEERARSIGFYDNIKLNPRQRGAVSPKTLRLVFAAIVGAVCMDSGGNEKVIREVVQRLYITKLPSKETNEQTISSCPETEINPTSLIDVSLEIGLGNQFLAESSDISLVHPNASLSIGDFSSEITSWAERATFEHQAQVQCETGPCPSELDGFTQFGEYLEHTVLVDCPEFTSAEDFDPVLDSFSQDPSVIPCQASDAFEQSSSFPPRVLQLHAEVEDVEMINFDEFIVDETVGTPISPSQRPQSRENGRGSGSVQQTKSVTSPKAKKRTYPTKHQKAHVLELNNYFERERPRCRDQGVAFWENGFELAIKQSHLPSLSGTDNFAALKILYFGIGSPEILAMLQALLKIRRELSEGQRREKYNLSPADRVKAIESGDERMAYVSLRKRCHIHQIFVDCTSDSLSVTNRMTRN